jgi:hypothetical protein
MSLAEETIANAFECGFKLLRLREPQELAQIQTNPCAVPLANINAEAAVMMMVVVMVMMVVMTMPVRPRNNAVIAVMVVMMMMMVVVLRDLFSALCLCRGDPRVIHLQRIQCIRNRLQEVAITGRWCVLCSFGNGRLGSVQCRQRSRSAQKPSNFLIHLFSSCWPQPKHTASA